MEESLPAADLRPGEAAHSSPCDPSLRARVRGLRAAASGIPSASPLSASRRAPRRPRCARPSPRGRGGGRRSERDRRTRGRPALEVFAPRLATSRAVTDLFQDRSSPRSAAPTPCGAADGAASLARTRAATSSPTPGTTLFSVGRRADERPSAWRRTTGDRSIAVAVLDTGVQANHRELHGVLDPSLGGNFIPCDDLKALFGLGVHRPRWTAGLSRRRLRGPRHLGCEPDRGRARTASPPTASPPACASAPTRFSRPGSAGSRAGSSPASSPPAPIARIDVVNMSIEGYMDPYDPFDADDYLLFTDAVDYCRARGVPVFAAAGNEHVRVDRVDLRARRPHARGRRPGLDRQPRESRPPPRAASRSTTTTYRGWLPVPGGVPGVTMVSATANAIGAAPANVPLRWRAHVGARDQLAYYSNYGSRVDLAAPGGARRYQIPGYDGGDGDILYGGWGSFGALSERGSSAPTPSPARSSTRPASRPGATASAGSRAPRWPRRTRPVSPRSSSRRSRDLRGRPEALVRRLPRRQSARSRTTWARTTRRTGAPASTGTPCDTGFCHVDQSHPIAFADAYGAGLVDAAPPSAANAAGRLA